MANFKDHANIAALRAMNYSHEFVTDVNHILQIYQTVKPYAGRAAVEVGSFWGHGTAALSRAGLCVKSCDPDPGSLPRRQAAAPDAEFALITGEAELQLPRRYAVVFHDSFHGETVVPELIRYWREKLDDDGLLIVHDVNEFDIPRFLQHLGTPIYSVTYDILGRGVGFFWKN